MEKVTSLDLEDLPTLGERCPSLFQVNSNTSTVQTYIVWEKGKNYRLVEPLVLSMKTYAHKTLKSCLKGHLFRTMPSYFEKP